MNGSEVGLGPGMGLLTGLGGSAASGSAVGAAAADAMDADALDADTLDAGDEPVSEVPTRSAVGGAHEASAKTNIRDLKLASLSFATTTPSSSRVRRSSIL
jgi:hypothetical protein